MLLNFKNNLNTSGGLSPEFQGIIRPPRQSSYGSPPSAPTSYSAAPAAAPASGGDSYGSPVAPVVNAAPASVDSYGSPAAPVINSAPASGGDSYGAPVAPVVSAAPASVDSYGSPAAPVVPPTYGSSSNNCDVIRSLTPVGDDCQQGGQECSSQCTTTQEQECTTEYEQQCRNVNEQVSYILVIRGKLLLELWGTTFLPD